MSGLRMVAIRATGVPVRGGFLPVIIPRGAIVDADNPAVHRFPERFRPATPNDVRIANARRRQHEDE